MKLYGSPFSPYARKARVLIIEKNIKCPFVEEDPWAAGTAIPSMNPLGKVPVLELAPGNCLFESPQVVHYLDHLDGKPLRFPVADGILRRQRFAVEASSTR